MKNAVVVISLCLCVFASACSSGPNVTRVDAGTQTDLSGRWNDTDVRIVCASLLNSAFSSRSIDSYIRDYSIRNNGAVPTIIVGRFRNTSSEHIDTSVISGIMRTTIINSGKLEFVEGGTTRDDIRIERQDQQSHASESTASALGNETAAVFMLTGEVNSMEERSGNTTVRAYYVTATITEIETNRILWEDQNSEIKKIIRQPRLRL